MPVNMGVNSVAGDVTQICIGVEGVARNIVLAYMGNSDGVAEEVYAARGKKLLEFAVGESVFLNVGGTLTEFLVVNHGIPEKSSLYDSSCDGTWLLAKDVYINDQIFAPKKSGVYSNSYADSDLHSYLNGDFFALLDTKARNKIKQVKIPYIAGLNENSHVASGANGLSAKVFLLCAYELGQKPGHFSSTDGQVYYTRIHGACLEYFKSNSPTAAYQGESVGWWTRTPDAPTYIGDLANIAENGSGPKVYTITHEGRLVASQVISSKGGVRPALIMSGNTRFDEETNEIL